MGMFLVWARMSRPQKEDARLSKGLQLLQSKIAILEDLSDRTDVQVRQLSALLSAKAVEVHQKTAEADRQIQAIEKNMQKSLELSKIFQDKIPHREIIERETSYKYIEAARMASQGQAADDIAKRLEIPLGEVEVIINMNRDQLIFQEEDIPMWAAPQASPSEAQPVPESAISPLREFGSLMADLPDDTLVDYQHPIANPGQDEEAPMSAPPPSFPPIPRAASTFTPVAPARDHITMPKIAPQQPQIVTTVPTVRPYQFPKIDGKPRY